MNFLKSKTYRIISHILLQRHSTYTPGTATLDFEVIKYFASDSIHCETGTSAKHVGVSHKYQLGDTIFVDDTPKIRF